MELRIFPLDGFLAQFPEFGDETKFPRPSLQGAGNRAMMHVMPATEGMPLQEPYRTYAVFLVTAHIATLAKRDVDSSSGSGDMGGLSGMAFKATVGSVSVETTKPNSFTSDDLTFWYSQTSYGLEYLAFMDVHAQPIYLETQEASVRDLP